MGQDADPSALFPFALPWDDASPTATSLTHWLDKPAGRQGFLTVKDGHIYAAGKRLRFMGVNLCFGACFPRHQDAEKIAARLAKFGVNCVRFHHMDMRKAPDGIFQDDMRTLDLGQLERLDYFIAQLKEQGIYSDLNLHVSRSYPGLPLWDGMPSFFNGVDNFDPRMVDLQRQYARDLLNHVNRYTKMPYAREPAVALIEINNENALSHTWWSGQLDEMPGAYSEELSRRWNLWLTRRYQGRSDFLSVWGDVAGTPGKLPLVRKRDFKEHKPDAQRDWVRFLFDTEEEYWTGLYRYLKEDLGSRGLVIGTQLGYSPFPIQARMDVVDVHSYWQHPRFPKRPWDPEDWTVANLAMAGREGGGTVPGLALRRVRGKPYVCTEYNHPAPNTYSSEAFLLLSAYAALQDWDGFFIFAYSHRRDAWNLGRIPGFFDIDQHPTKMVTLPASAAMFVRGDVKVASRDSTIGVSLDMAIDAFRRMGPSATGENFGLPRAVALQRSSSVVLDRNASPAEVTAPPAPTRIVSETGELVWDAGQGQGVVTVDAPLSKAVVGFLKGGYTLGDLEITPGTMLQDWAAITATVLEGQSLKEPARVVITATGYAQNTNMRWKDPQKTSVGRDWGEAPSVVEGISATLTFAVPPRRLAAWALDERGERKLPLVVVGEERAAVMLGPQYKTLWYEVNIR